MPEKFLYLWQRNRISVPKGQSKSYVPETFLYQKEKPKHVWQRNRKISVQKENLYLVCQRNFCTKKKIWSICTKKKIKVMCAREIDVPKRKSKSCVADKCLYQKENQCVEEKQEEWQRWLCALAHENGGSWESNHATPRQQCNISQGASKIWGAA